MKKFLALIMVIMMVISLAACGGNDGNTTETKGNSTETSASLEETTPAESVVIINEVDQTGEGEAKIDTPLYTATVPAGLKYEVYTYYSGEDNLATVEINFGKDYPGDFRLTVTTQRMIASLDDAVAECERMSSAFSGFKSEVLGEETHGANTFKKLNIKTEYSDTDYLVSYYKNTGAPLYADTYIEVMADKSDIDIADPLVTALIDSIVLK